MVLSSRISPVATHVRDVRRMRIPAQIPETVVRTITVPVAALQTPGSLSDERLENEPVDIGM